MKINYKLAIASLLVLISCTKKFDEINTNPDASTASSADWLATSMITSITYSDISNQKSFMQPFMLGKYILWSEGNPQGFQYNSLGRSSFGRLNVLRNVPSMLKYAATSSSTYPSYIGLAHFVRAWQFFQTTMQVGDIPYSQAILGESNNIIKPIYDNQKNVFLGILKELDQADSAFAAGTNFKGDFIYSGNVSQWRRLSNAFELYVLMNLYKKTSDNDLNVIQRFKDIVNNRPLMRDFKDNFAVTYQNTASYTYPWSNTSLSKNQFAIYTMVSSTLIDSLKAYKDRRLFYYTEPASAAISSGLAANDYNAYMGLEPSDVYSSTTTARSAGKFSDVNKRYLQLFNAEPVGLLNYWDQEFLLAEAAVRGWISDNASLHYNNGITSSMNFLTYYVSGGTTTDYTHGMSLDATYINSYLTGVALVGSQENQIKQIITQKYIAGFLQGCDYNAWYEFRRTGYPIFKLNAGTNQNVPSNKFPVRWMYPQSELDQNSNNYQASIQRQFAGVDDVNQVMWILK